MSRTILLSVALLITFGCQRPRRTLAPATFPPTAVDAGTFTYGIDAGSATLGPSDAGTADAGLLPSDAGAIDAGPTDAGASGVGSVDAGPIDAGYLAQNVEYVPECGSAVAPPEADLGCGSWILEQPLPTAQNLFAVWALAADDVWAVGAQGTLVHWDGTAWSVTSSPTTATLFSVWGADATHVWAGGDGGVLLEYDGVSWKSVSSPTTARITVLTGTAATDVWLEVPGSTGLFHWDGSTWTQPGAAEGVPFSASAAAIPVWPAGTGRAWSGGCADGTHASLWFWDGSQWHRTDTDVLGCVEAVAGVSASDVWATPIVPYDCGRATCLSYGLLHWDGTAWSAVQPGVPLSGSVFSPARGEVWVSSSGSWSDQLVFARCTGGAVQPFFSLPHIGYWAAMAATAADDVFIVGQNGVLARSDGKTTKVYGGPSDWIRGVWSDASGDAWIGAGGAFAQRKNGCWSALDAGKADYDVATSIGPMLLDQASASSPDDVWMVSDDNFAVHWNGQAFSQWPLRGVGGVWASPTGKAFFSGTGGVFRLDDSRFTQLDTPDPSATLYENGFASVWGTSDTDVWWLRGERANIDLVHFDGTAVTTVGSIPWSTGWLGQVLPMSAEDIWAIVNGRLMHFNGSTSTDLTPPVSYVWKIAVGGDGEVWVSAVPDSIWRYDGASWSKQNAPSGAVASIGGTIYSMGFGRVCRQP